jgi:hypothetical protein
MSKSDTSLNLDYIVLLVRCDAMECEKVAYLFKDSADLIESLILY